MSSLPEGWVLARIGDVGEIRLGKMLDRAKNQGEPVEYLRNINVRWFDFDLSDLQTMRATLQEREELSIRDGDLLVCEGGEPGRCAIWHGGRNDLLYQKALHRIRTSSAVIPEVLMYRLRHDAENRRLDESFTGTTIKHLTRESLFRYEIPLPPLNEQKRIADKLDAVLARIDTCCERLDRVPAILKCFRQSVLAAATSGKLTEEWREEHNTPFNWMYPTVGERCRLKSGKTLPIQLERASGAIPYVKVGDMNLLGNEYAITTSSRYLEAGSIKDSDLVPVRSVIFPKRGGAIATNKKRLIMEQPVAVDLNTMAIQCPDDLDEKFFFYWFQTVDLAKLDNGSTIPQVNNGDIAPLEFPEPGRKEQHEIVRRVEALFAYADKLEACYNTARAQVERLTPALLAKAFRGELVPQDPNDEPASVLLERIHALSVGRNKRSVSGAQADTGNGLRPYPGLRKKTREKA